MANYIEPKLASRSSLGSMRTLRRRPDTPRPAGHATWMPDRRRSTSMFVVFVGGGLTCCSSAVGPVTDALMPADATQDALLLADVTMTDVQEIAVLDSSVPPASDAVDDSSDAAEPGDTAGEGGNAVDIACAAFSACAVRRDGSVVCWGVERIQSVRYWFQLG